MHRSRLPLAIAVLVLAWTLPAGAVPIGDLHCNDSSGRPKAPYAVGTAVTISGTVTVGTGSFSTTNTDFYIQDATAGISIFKYGITQTFAMGDSVTISGTIAHYRGLTEISPTTMTPLATGKPLPTPHTMTCYQVANEYNTSTNCEPQEGMLIRIAGVTYTGTWGSNLVVTLHDESGTCDMFLDSDTGTPGMTPPQGRFDVVGILKQFAGFSPPFTSGYEIIPRNTLDFTPLPGPGITDGPTETDIAPNSVTIVWTTDYPCDSKIDYGYTTGYELATVSDPAMVTDHSITLTGLEPARIHVYRLTSANVDGTVVLPGMRFCSGSRSSGEIRAYFNKSVETSLALGEAAQGNVDFAPKLIERINAAQTSIDAVIYSFDLMGPADALIAAKNRGVAIRFVTDDRGGTYQPQVNRLIANGITVIDDAYGPNNFGAGLMHDKFWVFDHRLDTDYANDWVLTGSWNINDGGTYSDFQDIILIQDETLAEIYTAEVNEMWGSTSSTPDPALSRFSALKQDDTPKRLVIGGHPAQVYFGPSDDTMPALSARIAEAEYSSHFCIYAFTRADVSNALHQRFLNVPGFAVRGVFDSAQGSSGDSEYANLHGTGAYPWSPPADVWLDAETGTLHHKYMILDVNKHSGRPTVITGSSNWSNAANNENDENIIMVEDFRIANLYYQEFAARYHASGGTADLTVDAPDGVIPSSSEAEVFPNPATSTVTVRFTSPIAGRVTIALHDVQGRLIEQRETDPISAGARVVEIDFDRYPTGIYFLRISGAGIDQQRRITVVR
jgi:phosphatidylserine/phosphatidylglycerophosphate/cardiolipin synthase-like enzyme